MVQKLKLEKNVCYKKWFPKLIFLNVIFFFEKIPLILDIENWLWKYNFATFWGSVAMSIYKIQQFHLNTVDIWVKTLVFKDPSSNKLHDVTDITEGADIIGMSICLSAHFVPKTQISTGLWKIKKNLKSSSLPLNSC